ncbi:MAG: NADH-quinone oxidoreductase subunit NuoG [candidate division Zixibacteria bacterium]|nr:NADH-quinone oxidoreductase subunit NuoG [candidate division Zixibacteria bacterium]
MAEDNKHQAQGQGTVTLTIDGQQTTVARGTTVLEAAQALGINIPTFCWHSKLKSVGACRMCYVEIEKMAKLQVSCATEAVDGMVVRTDSDQVKQGRRAIIEFILLNHPLDCPTCDKGGECDLQNLTFAHGIDDSRFDFQKYRFREEGTASTFDDVRIGPEIVLNRNRCILCYKCVRANKEAFGEYDLGVYERGNIAEINAAPGEQVDNPYSGNLVEICPVGALTNTDWRYKIRVWLTQTTPAVCNFNSSGVNTTFFKENHQNRIFRVTSRRNDGIDDGWLSDVTRYGYQIVNSADRLKTPLVKKEGKQVPASWEEALVLIHRRFSEIKDKKGNVCIGGLIEPSLDNASLYSFSKFFRTVLPSNNIDFRSHYRMLPPTADSVFSKMCAQPFKIADIDDSDVIVAFGTDLVREHQNEYLRIRKARNFHDARIFAANPYHVKSADVTELELVYSVGTDESFLNAVCLAAIEEKLTDSAEAEAYRQKVSPSSLDQASRECGLDKEDLKSLARALAGARKVTFLAGELVTRSIAREAIAAALANLNRLLGINRKGQMAILPRYANSFGAEKLGLLPYPSDNLRRELTSMWGEFPDAESHNTDAMMALMKKEEISGFFVMGSNPVMLYPDREFAREGLEKLEFLVACDLFETETTAIADVVLPLCSWAEYDGEYVNLEGKSQKSVRAVKPIGEARPGCEIMNMLAPKFGKVLFESDATMAAEIDRLLQLDGAPELPFEFLPVVRAEFERDEAYPYPLFVCDDPHHSGHLTEKATSLANFVGEAYIELSPESAARHDLKQGDSVRVESKVGKVIVPARISDHIDSDAVLIPRNFSSTPVTSLLMRKKRLDWVRLSKVDV